MSARCRSGRPARLAGSVRQSTVRTKKAVRRVGEGWGVAKFGELSAYGRGMPLLVCLRCKASVGIEDEGSSIRLIYDFNRWQQSDCCCPHLDGPVNCRSFDD